MKRGKGVVTGEITKREDVSSGERERENASEMTSKPRKGKGDID